MVAEHFLKGGVEQMRRSVIALDECTAMLVDLRREAVSGRELEERLDRVRITVNKNKIPGDTRPASETSGIRGGTPAVTARGFRADEAREVGELLVLAIRDFDARKDEIVARVDALCKRFPLYE